jgi:CRISPR-associated exonuclease Cas4
MPRRAETFVYRRRDESLHWSLGQVVPPSLGDALLAEETEKRNENLRLLYVACTRAMELLIIPDFTWSNDASWAKLLDFKLDSVPELDISRLPRANVVSPTATENLQKADVFAEEQSRLEASPRIRWVTPSDGDPDVITGLIPSEASDDEPLRSLAVVEGGRVRGILLHKLMEELVTGELDENAEAVIARAALLRDQLRSPSSSDPGPDTMELATTALRTLQLPDIKPYRARLVAELPIHGIAPTSSDQLIVGRADAVADGEDGDKIAFDWKSDVAPKESDRVAYRQQLGQYLHVLGARRGAIVYMTSGRVDWISR